MKKYAIIVAGGSGTRMQTTVPKQFLILKNRPVLMHTIEIFFNYNNEIELIVALPENQLDYWEQLCEKYQFIIPHTIVKGGKTRFHSVKNALAKVSKDALVAIHDGVRPCVSFTTIKKCFETAEKYGAALPVTDVVESLRKIEGDNSVAVNRKNYKLVQTPQVFKSKIIKTAYNQEYNEKFTDDASVVEYSGTKIALVNGNRENIKITTPTDLEMAENLVLASG